MFWLRAFVLGTVLVALVQACSAGDSRPVPSSEGPERLGQIAEAISAACSVSTIGLPCDPDGPAKPKLECEGVCALGGTGLATCKSVAAGTLDGLICGTTNGVGNAACTRYCSGKTCLVGDTPAGAACRPTAGSTPCDGQCNGNGNCTPIGSACPFGRDEQLCTFQSCDFNNATDCVVNNLTRYTQCSDADACAIGECNARGTCVPGPIVGCNDGNACTDDSCDSSTGACIGSNDDTNACSDGNACTTGEFCASGTCVPGVTPVVCNDNSQCTTDSCDPNTGCAYVSKSCDDVDACTDDSCNPADGVCSHSTKTCNDADSCTTDTCDSGVGCVFTPINCDDADACTADSCTAGACQHAAISCDDSDPCTTDSCLSVGGCQHAPIVGCGGSGGAGGEGGQPAIPEGGAPATAGAPSGGAPTEAGAPSSEAGQSGAGAPAEGGTGQGGEPTSAGTSGSAGTGGSPTAGNTSGGNSSGATAGSSTEGGDDAVPGIRTVEDGGCGCRSVGSSPSGQLGLALGALGVVLLRRRRRA